MQREVLIGLSFLLSASGAHAQVAPGEPGALPAGRVQSARPLDGAAIEDADAASQGSASGLDDETDALGWGEGPGDDLGWGDGGDSIGFSDVDAEALPTPPPAPPASAWSGTGSLRSDSGVWLERFSGNPVAKLRLSGDLALRSKWKDFRLHAAAHYERDFAYLVERESYDQATLREYEEQIRLRETFVGYGHGAFDISAGFQIVAWGQGDVVSPLDVVNPRDLREPGLSDLDDLRMPVLSTILSVFLGDHRLEGMVIHEAFFGLRSPPFGPFSPAAAVFSEETVAAGAASMGIVADGQDVSYSHRPARYAKENQQFLARWVYKGAGLDVGVYAASVLDQIGVFSGLTARAGFRSEMSFPLSSGLAPAPRPLEVDLVLDHPRYTLLGHSGALPVSDFVLKWEAVALIDRAVNVGDEQDPAALATDRARVLGGMLGLTYGGIPDTTLFLEVAHNLLVNSLSADPLFPVELSTFALRSQTTFLKQRLTLSLAGTFWGWRAQYGGLLRVELDYSVLDGFRVGAGAITYQPSERLGPIVGFDRHDRAYVKLRYDFGLF